MRKEDAYYEAMLARDYRFDGKFFVGVKTTGVYCRPICPARPKRENVEFFTTALAAEKAGYRPCLRCRPECAPASPTWCGKTELVQRALKAISGNALFEIDEDAFAQQFGVSARHLRRLFDEEIGQTPKQISDNHRLDFARKLVVETDMSIITVAFTAGFRSLRRFNDAFKKRFHRKPTEVRKHRAKASKAEGIELSLSFRPPYDWQTVLNFFRSHHLAELETVDDHSFSRVFSVGETTGYFQVRKENDEPRLKLKIVADDPKIIFDVVTRVRKMFDLDSDPLLIANSFRAVPTLAKLYERYPGLRLPRSWDPFETAVGTIVGQCVSVEQAVRVVHQLIRVYGPETKHPVTGKPTRLFPTAEMLARSDLAELKTTNARKETIRALCQKFVNREISLSDTQDPAAFRKQLLEIKGIGPWSAEYIALRTIGDTDAFPGTDLILKRALQLHPDLDINLVRPWRSYAAIYLWKEYAPKLTGKAFEQMKEPCA